MHKPTWTKCERCQRRVRIRKDGHLYAHQCKPVACPPPALIAESLRGLVAARCKPTHQVTVTMEEVEPGFRPILSAGFLEVLAAHPGGTEFVVTVHGRCKDCDSVHLLQGASVLVPRGRYTTAEELYASLSEETFWGLLDQLGGT